MNSDWVFTLLNLLSHSIRIHLTLISILHQSVSSTHYEVLYGIPKHEIVRYFADGHNRVCSFAAQARLFVSETKLSSRYKLQTKALLA